MKKCKHIDVPEDCCFIRFGRAKYSHSDDMELETLRGETITIDFDKKGKVIGIELVGDNKPCQTATKRRK